MTTERSTSVTIENDEVRASVSSNGKSYVYVKRMGDVRREDVFRGTFTEFAEFEEFVEALVISRAMLRTELALAAVMNQKGGTGQ